MKRRWLTKGGILNPASVTHGLVEGAERNPRHYKQGFSKRRWFAKGGILDLVSMKQALLGGVERNPRHH